MLPIVLSDPMLAMKHPIYNGIDPRALVGLIQYLSGLSMFKPHILTIEK